MQTLDGRSETLTLDCQSTVADLKHLIVEADPDLRNFTWSLALGDRPLRGGRMTLGALGPCEVSLQDCGVEEGATLTLIKKARVHRAPIDQTRRAPSTDCVFFFGYNGMSFPGVVLQVAALFFLYRMGPSILSAVAMSFGVYLVWPLHDHHGWAQYMLQLLLVDSYLCELIFGVQEIAGPSDGWVAPAAFSAIASVVLAMIWMGSKSRPFNDDTGLAGMVVLPFTALVSGIGSLAACFAHYSIANSSRLFQPMLAAGTLEDVNAQDL